MKTSMIWGTYGITHSAQKLSENEIKKGKTIIDIIICKLSHFMKVCWKINKNETFSLKTHYLSK